MIVIEIRDQQPESYNCSETNIVDVLNLDYLFIRSKSQRVVSALLKGLLASFGLLAVSGFQWCLQNHFVVGLITSIALAFVVNEYVEQQISGSKLAQNSSALKTYIRGLNPAPLAAIPIIFLLSTMNIQTLLVALSNTIEVVGIACGVPLLLYGLIKIGQEANFGKTHLYVGSASAFGGVALSIIVNLVFSNVSDLSIFSATNYFGNAIAAIYAPNVVLPLEQ
jgi:hypothetical protein